MPDLRIRNIDATTYQRMKLIARRQGKSLAQVARNALAEKFREEIWTEADRLRAKIGRVSDDSTRIIREWRDNDEPYR